MVLHHYFIISSAKLDLFPVSAKLFTHKTGVFEHIADRQHIILDVCQC